LTEIMVVDENRIMIYLRRIYLVCWL